MSQPTNRDITDEAKRRLRLMLGADLQRKKPSPQPPQRDYRFGVGMMLTGLLSAIVGMYPLPADLFTRVMFLFFGVVMALIGGYYIDRSTKAEREAARAQAKDHSEDQ